MHADPTAPIPATTFPALHAGHCYASSCGRVTLYQCEAREIVPKLKNIDAVVTDPPYAVTSQASSEVSRATRQTRETQFFESWLREEIGRLLLCCKPTAAMWMTIDWRGAMVLDTVCARLNIKEPKIGVWDKESIGMGGVLRNSYECFAVVTLAEWENLTRSERDVWQHRWTQGNRDSEHPAEKPIPLFVRALNLICKSGAKVLDPYMGSGTTGIACLRSGRDFVGIERDPDRYAEAVERITNELAQGDLFLGHNEKAEALSLSEVDPPAAGSARFTTDITKDMHCNHKLSKAHEEPVCRTCGANLLNHEPHMKIEIALKDINGKALEEGSCVCAYAQDYAEISRDESGGIPVIEVDHAKPKPIKDVPLFIGRVVWNPEQLAIEIAIEEMLVEWDTSPSRVRMGGGNYAYELIG